jgi:GH24 family phage-related lysozyme (muramidase)
VNTGPDGIALVKSFEGCRLKAYPDPGTGGEPWTVGWGTTRYANGQKVQPGDTVTQAEADALLRNDLARCAAQVTRAIGDAPTTQKQFDALVSFHYNTGALLSSTLLRKHKAGDYAGAAAEFLRWTHAGGKVLPGLVKRRAAEAALYSQGTPA